MCLYVYCFSEIHGKVGIHLEGWMDIWKDRLTDGLLVKLKDTNQYLLRVEHTTLSFISSGYRTA